MEVLMGKSSINGPFSMAMLNNQRVYFELLQSVLKKKLWCPNLKILLRTYMILSIWEYRMYHLNHVSPEFCWFEYRKRHKPWVFLSQCQSPRDQGKVELIVPAEPEWSNHPYTSQQRHHVWKAMGKPWVFGGLMGLNGENHGKMVVFMTYMTIPQVPSETSLTFSSHSMKKSWP